MGEILTSSLEDYLEVIYIIHKNGNHARITDIANILSCSKASVNQAMNALKAENLIMQEKYGKISLTPKGVEVARGIYEKHEILSKFFTKVLGVSPEVGEIDACKAEHILSNETLESIRNFLIKSNVCILEDKN